ncbi:MAG: HEPN domain-containing protein [Cyanobacteria bacterium P01_E01_bin.6]
MTDRQLQLLVQFRLTEAEETLREAEILLAQSAFRGSVNRSYYAMFYAVSGLLATRGLGTSKHIGVMGLVDREFVKTGVFSKELSRSFHRAFDERQASDYGEMLMPDQELAAGLLGQAKMFIHEIKAQLAKVGFEL